VELNPAQQKTLERLAAALHERPRFDPLLAGELRAELHDRLEPVAARLTADLFVSKHRLSAALGCEVGAAADTFEWTPARARGAVAHKAIELSVVRRDDPAPLDLIEDAIASHIESMSSLGDWLSRADPGTVAQVRAEANGHLCAFLECWPPIEWRWTPVVESSITVDLFDGRIRLSGRPDLTLGRARGDIAGKVIVDLKTGQAHQEHVDDLRFYALIDTLKIGIPPRLLVNSYLDRALLAVEQVTEDQLRSTVDRVVDAVGRIVTLEVGERDPEKRPGPQCRWCVLRSDCDEGRAHLESLDVDDFAVESQH
jgi:hypothetical protein